MAAKYSTQDEEVKHISTESTSGIGKEVEDDLENVDFIDEVFESVYLQRKVVDACVKLFVNDLKVGKKRQGL